jgi:hypothetical protein
VACAPLQLRAQRSDDEVGRGPRRSDCERISSCDQASRRGPWRVATPGRPTRPAVLGRAPARRGGAAVARAPARSGRRAHRAADRRGAPGVQSAALTAGPVERTREPSGQAGMTLRTVFRPTPVWRLHREQGPTGHPLIAADRRARCLLAPHPLALVQPSLCLTPDPRRAVLVQGGCATSGDADPRSPRQRRRSGPAMASSRCGEGSRREPCSSVRPGAASGPD